MKESTAVENLHRAVVASKLQLFFFLSISGKGHPVEAAHSARDVHRWQQCAPQLLEQFGLAGSELKSNVSV